MVATVARPKPPSGPSQQARSAATCTCTQLSTASRGSRTPNRLPTKGATAAAFLARVKVWFAAHGIDHIQRIVTDNGACYRSGDFAGTVGQKTRHQKTRPYTPWHNGKVERYQRILAE